MCYKPTPPPQTSSVQMTENEYRVVEVFLKRIKEGACQHAGVFEYKMAWTARSVLGLCKEVLAISASNLRGSPQAEPAGWGPPCHFGYAPPIGRVDRCLLSPGCDAEHPGPAPAERPVRAAEPPNNPLEISGHFMCLKLSLCLSMSWTGAGELSAVADLHVPPSVP